MPLTLLVFRRMMPPGLADVVSRDGVVFRHVELLYQVNNGALGPLLTARVIAKRVAEVVLY